jgi:MoxR-like ATPase
MPARALPASIDQTLALLSEAGYIADRALATVLFLSLKMGRPIFLEGEAGVGKTEIAKVLAATLGRKLIRLQCYEGLDVSSAVYEWNYAAQMVEIRLAEAAGGVDRQGLSKDIFTDRFLIKRPILQALEPDPAGAPILLIDELDRADEAFEAFLWKCLRITRSRSRNLAPSAPKSPPIVVVTTNRTREIHDALKRRCFYHWVDYPSAEQGSRDRHHAGAGHSRRPCAEVVGFVQRLRGEDLLRSRGAETLDWAGALTELDQIALDPATGSDTLGVLLKYQDGYRSLEGSRSRRFSMRFAPIWPPRNKRPL